MRQLPILLSAALLASPALPVSAADDSVARRLDALGVKYEVDSDGDYKSTYSYSKEQRTQLVFVRGKTEEIRGVRVREVFAPAGRVAADRIDGARALKLLADSGTNKLGAWEIHGDTLFYVVKFIDNDDAKLLELAMDVTAETADDMEIELSGDRDDL